MGRHPLSVPVGWRAAYARRIGSRPVLVAPRHYDDGMRDTPSKRLSWALTATVVVVAAVLAWTSTWPFDERPPPLDAEPSLWQLLLADRVTIGFVRLAFVALSVWVASAVPVFVLSGRWPTRFAWLGTERDDAADAVARLTAEVADLKRQRDEYRRVAEEYRQMVDVETQPDDG